MMIFVEHAMTTSERTEPTSAYHLHYSDASQCSNSNLMSGLALALRMECYRRQPNPHANVSRRLSAAVWHEVDRIIDQTTRQDPLISTADNGTVYFSSLLFGLKRKYTRCSVHAIGMRSSVCDRYLIERT